MKARIGVFLTFMLAAAGTLYFNNVFSQPEIEILRELSKVEGNAFFSKVLFFYMFARFVTNILVDVTKPFRDKIAEYINTYIDTKIKQMRDDE